MFKSVSLKSTINHIVCDFAVNDSHEQDDDYNWTDLVQKCIEGRQQKIYTQIPEFSISESESSMVPPVNLFEESEIGRDANFSKNEHQILLPEPALLATSFEKDLPVTVIEEIEPSAYELMPPVSPEPADELMPPVSPEPANELMPPVSPESSFSAHSSPIPSPISIANSPSPVHRKSTKSTKSTQQKQQQSTKDRPARFLAGKRLQTWRGEHPIYVPIENGCYKVVGTTKPHTPDHFKRKRKTKSKENEKEKPALTTSFVDNSETTREKLKSIFMNRQTLNWKKSKFDDKIEHATLAKNKETSQIVGYIRFSGKSSKPTQKSGHMNIFVLLKGNVSFKVGDDPPVLINDVDPVIVPESMSYSIENLLDSEAILLFTIF